MAGKNAQTSTANKGGGNTAAGASAGGDSSGNGGQQTQAGQGQQTEETTILGGGADQAAGSAADGTQNQDAAQGGDEGTVLGGSADDLELKLPEGFDAKSPVLGQFKAAAKELGLKSDGAQKLFDVYVSSQKAAAAEAEQRHAAEFKATQAQWVADMKKDPEIGGAKWPATVKAAQAGYAHAPPDFRKWAKDAGMENYPPFVKLFAWIGNSIADDSIAGDGAGDGTAAPKTGLEKLAARLYGTKPNTRT